MRRNYFTVGEIAQILERGIDNILNRMSIGALPFMSIPGNGQVKPQGGIPPYSRPSEED